MRCAKHDFKTIDAKDWNKHFLDHSHTITSTNRKCNKCGTLVERTVYTGTIQKGKNHVTCEACNKQTYEDYKAKMEAIEKAKKEVPAQ